MPWVPVNQDVPLDGCWLFHHCPIWLPNCARQGPMNGLPPVRIGLRAVPCPMLLAWLEKPASSSTACSESAIRFAAQAGWLAADGRRCSNPNLPLHLPVEIVVIDVAVGLAYPRPKVLLAQVVVQALAVALAVQVL